MPVLHLSRFCFVIAFPLALLPVAAQVVAAQVPAKPLTVETIYAHGSLVGQPPSGLTWSPDGKHLTYLDGGELVDVDPSSGKSHILVSRAKLAALAGPRSTETDKDHRDRYHMASYLWAPDSIHLLFDYNGRLWMYDLRNGTGIQIGSSGTASGDDPKFSPSGEYISFVREHGIHIVNLKDPGTPTVTLAPAAGPNVLNGEVDWLYLEELETRSNYFWSPDSKNIAFLQMNETKVPQYPIADWIPEHTTVDLQHYPQPGDSNPDVRVGVVHVESGKTNWVKLPIESGQDYVPRFGWVTPKTLWVETLDREQKRRTLYFADAVSGKSHVVLELSDGKFLDEAYDVSVGYGSIILASWSDGHNHLYLYDYDEARPEETTARLQIQLTKGDFEVGEVLRVDHQDKLVDFLSNESNPFDQQLWQVDFSGGRKQLTAGSGTHTAILAPHGEAFVERASSRMDPPHVSLCPTTSTCKVIWSTQAVEAYSLRSPETLEVKAHDGTIIHATLLLPQTGAPASVPLIVNPYGGPGTATVVNRWSDSLLFDELLVQRGFAVLHADNRGSGGRGRSFAQACFHNFGPIQFEDQLTVIDAVLAKYPQLDPKRLGWWGWSWGGTFTLYAMSHSERFRAGVAVAPVTDWRNYDSVYTERYLSRPSEFPNGYRDFSVVNSAADLKGHLLLVHGTGDDNVHLQNSIQFVQRLIEAGVPYDLQIYPRKTHSISGPDVRTHLFYRILAHFETYLMPATTPTK